MSYEKRLRDLLFALMTELDDMSGTHSVTGQACTAMVARISRTLQETAPHRAHKLTPTGDAQRSNLVAARINLRREGERS